jgi:Protein of unknown function (DUF1552)
MIITQKAINRRTVLRGIGTTLLLPLLDSMVPALRAAPKAKCRLGVVYVPNGIVMQNWTPAAHGAVFDFTPTLKPLEPFREQVLVLSGLNSTPIADGARRPPGSHARASTRFLTDIPPKPTLSSDLGAGISMDQIAAKELGHRTPLGSLELSLDSNDTSGTSDPGYSRAYTSTIAWRSATTPLPMENNPRKVFERLFGDSTSTDRTARLSGLRRRQSVLDAINDKLAALKRQLGPSDRLKLDEYFDAVRDAERRIQNSEDLSAELPVVEHPAGIPNTFAEHAKLMYDLCVLAYQCDLTRVMTFMLTREFSGRTYPELGINEAHHPLSHHENDPVKLASLARIDAYHITLFSHFVDRLRTTPDGDGTLLDHVMLIYGAGMADGNEHSPFDLPILLVGGGAGQLNGGRHLRYAKGTPLANLHLTLLDKLHVAADQIGDSTGEFENLG